MSASVTRRKFLRLAGATAGLAAAAPAWTQAAPPRVGIALGGGGARGLAHVVLLQVLDDLGVRPNRIAGTSIGGVVGALYAQGHSAADIKKLIHESLVAKKSRLSLAFVRKDFLKWANLVDAEVDNQRVLDSDDFLSFLHAEFKDKSFADLKIPLSVVAADVWQHEQVVFTSGDLLPAVKSSIAIPGLFNPMELGGRVLVDGGAVNPVPYDLLLDDCDVVIAVDVAGIKHRHAGAPGFFEVIFGTLQTMEKSILQEKIRRRPPHIFLQPPLEDIHLLDFGRAEEIYKQTEPAAAELRTALAKYFPSVTT